MEMDYINKEVLLESIKDVERLIKENYRLKAERDEALMALLLLFVSQPEEVVYLPQFDRDVIPDVIDHFKLHVNPCDNSYMGDKPQSKYTVAIKRFSESDYYSSKSPSEVLNRLNDLLERFVYDGSTEYVQKLVPSDNGLKLIKVSKESEVSNG